MANYIRSDLEFILAQIKVAEAHADGAQLFGPDGLVPAYTLSVGLRTVDGTYNNLLPGQEKWGAADIQFPTLLDPTYKPASAVLDMNGPAPGGNTAASYAPTNLPNNNPASIVVDSSLRTISNLIVDQTLSNPAAIMKGLEIGGEVPATMANVALVQAIYDVFKPFAHAAYQTKFAADHNTVPANQAALDAAAAAAAAALETARDARNLSLEPFGIAMDGDNVQITNVAPDEGLSAPFNSWFTLFGQFFDHGLDLVGKGGSGTVYIPLQPDDPLYVAGSPTNFMVLTRATVLPGPDNVMNTADDIRPINTTTSFVDQNQTYTSHSSHQVFLRQYVLNAAGDPVATGHLIEGANGGMATWGEVKWQAEHILGIKLTDFDVGNVPLVRTDQYGNFIPAVTGNPATNGMPQLITGLGLDGIPNTSDDIVAIGNVASPVDPTVVGAFRTGHAFLADIAHEAVPVGKIADGDITIGLGNPGNGSTEYDNELLDRHFIAGDGRVNENIGLTAVHHIFHSEHNRLADHTKSVLIADAQAMLAGGATQAASVAFLNEWLINDVATVPVTAGAINALVWDGERIFQAAKFGTEMQYQHLVFEDFARKIQPNIDFFVVPDGYHADINPSIVAEFAHVVYRFGHSMLTETIDRLDPTFTSDNIGLIEAFLNPIEFDADHTVLDGVAAGDIIRGMTRQLGNEIDEFVTSALRNNLLGLPLDLPTINLARGRDTGVPSLNAARREFFEASSNAPELKPYISWVDFAGGLKNEASVINFMAAYGTHSFITGETTIEGKRAAAMAIIFGTPQTVADNPNTPSNEAHVVAVPPDALDFLNSTGAWANLAGGVTTTGVDAIDLWIGGLAEKITPFGGMLGSTFNFVFEVQLEKLQDGDRFYYLQRLDGLHFLGEMENNTFAKVIGLNADAGHLPSDVFSAPGLILEVDPTKQYNPQLDDPNTAADESGDDPQGSGILTQLVIRNNPGTPGLDSNYLRYTGDEHVLLGGTNANDIITASIGDDTLYGDGGNDRLEAGHGNDSYIGGDGHDIITDIGGDDIIRAGTGHDAVNAGAGTDLVIGDEGQDFIVLGADLLDETFAGTGNDFILGSKTTELTMGNEGDDWIEIGAWTGAVGDNFDDQFAADLVIGHDVFHGDGGFDEFIGEGGDDIWVGSLGRGKFDGMSGFDWATYTDLPFGINADLFRQHFDALPLPPPDAALDEYSFVEGISGSAFNDQIFGSDVTAADMPTEGARGSVLNAAGIALIDGMQALLGAGVTSFDAGNILLGGDGNDEITGRGGNDIIDGDKWLDVRIDVMSTFDANGPTGNTVLSSHHSMTTLVDDVFAGLINPGQLKIARKIETANGIGDIDTAIFSDVRANYTITSGPGGRVIVAHTGGTLLDGIDTLLNIERLRFSDIETGVAPSDIKWNGVVPGNTTLPGLNTVVANLATDFPGSTFSLVAGPDFTVSATGVVTRVNSAMSTNSTYTLTVTATGGAGAVTETFTIRTGTAGVDSITTTPGDDVVYGLAGVDTLNGGDKDDTLFGQDGNDILNGGNGNDMLNGGAGADAMTGGAGDDTFVVDDTTAAGGIDTVVEAVGGGTDTVSTALTYTLGANVENLTLTGTGNVNGTGNGLDNVITGNSGDNDLFGGLGNDTYRTSAVDGDDDEISDSGGTADRLTILTGGAALTELSFVDDNTGTNNGNLDIGYDGQDISIIDHFDQTNESVELINFDNGSYAGYQFGRTDYKLNSADPANSGSPSARTVAVATGNNLLAGESSANRMTGGTGNDLIFGAGGADIIDGGAGNDLLVGGSGNDNINGGADDDIIAYTIGDGTDTVNGGAGAADQLNILGDDNDNDTLDVVFNGTVLTSVEGGAVTGVELINADLLGDDDTLNYSASTVAVTVDLDAGTASGFESILNIEDATGGSGNDTLIGDDLDNVLNGGAGADVLNGGGGEDSLFGGVGVDTIDVGAGDDAEDVVRFDNTTEFGDTIANFSSDDVDSIADFIVFGGTLNTAWDDGNNNNNFLFASSNSGGGTVNANVGQNNGDIEALILNGANGEGVTTANLLNAALIATAFNNEFVITAANGEDAFLVVNDTNNDSASLWQWVQAGGGEITAAELTLIGFVQSNASITTANFDFV